MSLARPSANQTAVCRVNADKHEFGCFHLGQDGEYLGLRLPALSLVYRPTSQATIFASLRATRPTFRWNPAGTRHSAEAPQYAWRRVSRGENGGIFRKQANPSLMRCDRRQIWRSDSR